jgi:hypothetical protein
MRSTPSPPGFHSVSAECSCQNLLVLPGTNAWPTANAEAGSAIRRVNEAGLRTGRALYAAGAA